MSEEAEPRTVSEMLDQLEAGTMTLDQAVAWARTHARPPVSLRASPDTGTELFAETLRDPEPLQRESFAEVAQASFADRIDLDAYEALMNAYLDGQSENRPPTTQQH